MSHTPPPGAAGPSWPGGRRGSRGPNRGPQRPHPPFPFPPAAAPDPGAWGERQPWEGSMSPQKEPSGSPTALPGVPPPPPGPRNPPTPGGNPNPPSDPPRR
jgi:hypothetical protein